MQLVIFMIIYLLILKVQFYVCFIERITITNDRWSLLKKKKAHNVKGSNEQKRSGNKT